MGAIIMTIAMRANKNLDVHPFTANPAAYSKDFAFFSSSSACRIALGLSAINLILLITFKASSLAFNRSTKSIA